MSVSPGILRAARAGQVLLLLGLLLYAAQATVELCGESATDFFETWLYPGLLLGSALLCLTRAAAVRRERAAWLVIGAGLVAWAAGDLYSSLKLDLMDEPPLPSLSDALWLAFYPACYVAIVLLLRERVRDFRRSLWLDGLVGALAIAALAAALFAGPITSGDDPTVVAVDLSYLLGDLLLLGFIVAVFAVTAWRPGPAWAVLGASLAAMAAVDAFFLYQGATGADVSMLPAALWPASGILVGVAAWQRPERRSVRVEGWRVLILPAAFAVTALTLLAFHGFHRLNALAVALALATLLAVVVRMATTFGENMRLLEGMRRDALTDSLTGLGNRRRLMVDLARAIGEATEERPAGLVMFDLDGFKQYNDRFGHPVGDALLARLGRELSGMAGNNAEAYRLGGDEFCVIAFGSEDELRGIALRAQAALADNGGGFAIGASFGLVLIPREADDVAHALNVADERLYEQKGLGRRSTVSRQTGDALAQVLHEVQPDLNGHLSEVAELARLLGHEAGLRPGQLDEVIRAAQLHDIGKVALPAALLAKRGPLDPAEWEFIRQHTLVGDRILSAAPALTSVAAMVRASHENWDGSGYPDGLIGEQIPYGARVVAICDAYHAMTQGRPYRGAVSHEEALEELRRCAGEQFDPDLVELFCVLMEPAGMDGARPARAHELPERSSADVVE